MQFFNIDFCWSAEALAEAETLNFELKVRYTESYFKRYIHPLISVEEPAFIATTSISCECFSKITLCATLPILQYPFIAILTIFKEYKFLLNNSISLFGILS